MESKSPFSQRFTSLLEKSVEKSLSWFELYDIVFRVKVIKYFTVSILTLLFTSTDN